MSKEKKWWQFGKNATKQNNSPTYHYNEFEYSNPQNVDYYNLNIGLAQKLPPFILICQLISGLTSLIVFFLTAFNKMPVLPYGLNYAVSAGFGILVVMLFEIGGKEAMTVAWRQMLTFNFKNGTYVATFFVVLTFAIGTAIINASSSQWGGEEIAALVSNAPKPLDVSQNENKKQDAIAKINAVFEKTKQGFEKQLTTQKKAIDSKLALDVATIKLKKQRFASHKKTHPNSVWADNNLLALDSKIAATKAAAEKEKKELTDKMMNNIALAQSKFDAQLTAIDTVHQKIIATNLQYQKAQNAKTIARNKRMEGWLPLISVLAVLGVIFGIGLRELFLIGSGIDRFYMRMPKDQHHLKETLAFQSGQVQPQITMEYKPKDPTETDTKKDIENHLKKYDFLDEKPAEKSQEKPQAAETKKELQEVDNQVVANEISMPKNEKKKTQNAQKKPLEKSQEKTTKKTPKIDAKNQKLLNEVFKQFEAASSAFEHLTYENDKHEKKREHQLMVKSALLIAKTKVTYGLVGIDFGNLSPMHSGLTFQRKYGLRHNRFGYKKPLKNKFDVLVAAAKKNRKELADA